MVVLSLINPEYNWIQKQSPVCGMGPGKEYRSFLIEDMLEISLCTEYSIAVVVQSLNHVPLFTTPWTAAYQAFLSFTISQSVLKFMSFESVMPTISSSVIPFSSCLQSFPASGSFTVSWLFTSDGQSIGASASASVLPMNIQSWFPLGLTGFISLLSKGLSKSSPAPQFKSINSLVLSLLYDPALTSIHDYWKNHSFD